MSIRAKMIIIPLSIVINYCLTKNPTWSLLDLITYDFNLVGWSWRCLCVHYHGKTTYLCAPLRVLSHIHYINLGLRCNFIICGYGFLPSLHREISYLRTISVYDLWIYFYFSFVSTLQRLFTYHFTLYAISCPVSFCAHSGIHSLSSDIHVGIDLFLVWTNLNHISNMLIIVYFLLATVFSHYKYICVTLHPYSWIRSIPLFLWHHQLIFCMIPHTISLGMPHLARLIFRNPNLHLTHNNGYFTNKTGFTISTGDWGT